MDIKLEGNPSYLEEINLDCSYIKGRIFTSENFLVESLTSGDLDRLLQEGYRHFGNYFFRPVCGKCHRCIPLRIPVHKYEISRSAKRLLKNNKEIKVSLENPEPSYETYMLYRSHKKKFGEPVLETYEDYIRSFFTPLEFNYQLTMKIKEKIICISHIDITDTVLSAVYCYYDTAMDRLSLGTYAIQRELMIAQERNIPYMYLGYFIEESPHMRYKIRFRPNQALLRNGKWVNFIDKNGTLMDKKGFAKGFRPTERLSDDSGYNI